MKKITVLLALVFMLLLIVPSASAAPSSYDSGFQVQNLSNTTTANIVITFYKQDGSIETTLSDTIAAGDSNTYFPLGVAAGFNGSVVISSDQPVAAIANVLGDGFDFGASYASFDGGANSVNLPLVMKGNSGFDTWFNIQNTGAASTDVTVSYAGTSCTEGPITIQPGAAKTFDQTTNSCLPAGYVGAANVTASSGGEIVATAMETGSETLFAYNGFTGGATNPVMPLVQFNNVGFHSGVQIQNTGTTATNVTLSFSPASGQPGTACTETKTINGGQSETFGLFAFSLSGPAGTNTCTFGERFVGSAQVTANSAGNDLVAVVNQTNFTNYGSAYNGFDPAIASETVTMPLIMDRNSGFYTGFNLMNVGSSTTVSCTFTGSSYTVGGTLNTGGTLNDLQLNKIASSYVGGATCSAPGGAIIAVVNELGDSTTSDLLFTYEAFNQ